MAKEPSRGEGEKDRPAAERKRQGGDAPVRPQPSAKPLAETRVENDLAEKMLGEFRVLRRLGHGGMAEVYLAERTSLRRNVAVKVLHENRLSDPSYLARFKREALAAASLSHPNIVQVIVVGEQDGIHYIAQEYVPGLNLRELLTRKGPPEQALAIRIIRQVANALHAAHEAGIVHRDIKPENIMITRKGDVKVADFGLAQLTQVENEEDQHLTRDGVTMGTPLYMSPEQVRGKEVDSRSDIYSLGVTCYHMLTGSPPFRGPTAMSIAVQHLKNEPEPLEPMRGDLPPLLCRMVHKMMAKKPEQRYQTAQAILKDLKRLAEDPEQQVEGTATDPQETELSSETTHNGNFVVRLARGIWHAPDWSLARQIWVLILLALIVGGASAGVGWVSRTSDPFLTAPPRDQGVPRQETAAGQYFYALQQKDNIEAWRAVVENFSGSSDRLFRNYAEEQLAVLFLTKRRHDDAQEIFDRFADYSEPRFRAFGLAGQTILWNLRGDYQQSQKVADKLRYPIQAAGNNGAGNGADAANRPQILFDLLDDKMRSAVTETLHRNIEKLNRQMSQEWDDIFKHQEHSPNSQEQSAETAH